MGTWFADWFNSKYYHLLYKNRNDEEAAAFIERLLNELQLPSQAKVLDLACGKGRHARTLSKHDLKVYGCDLAEDSIAFAEKVQGNQVSYFVHDMREPFPEKDFSVVFNLFTSFGYFDSNEEDLLVFKNIYEALDHKGYFVFDYLNLDWLERTLVPEEEKVVEGVKFNIQRKIEDGFILKEIVFEDAGESYRFVERVEALSKEIIVAMLEQAGFKVEQLFGSYELEEYHKENSSRVIIIASKWNH